MVSVYTDGRRRFVRNKHVHRVPKRLAACKHLGPGQVQDMFYVYVYEERRWTKSERLSSPWALIR